MIALTPEASVVSCGQCCRTEPCGVAPQNSKFDLSITEYVGVRRSPGSSLSQEIFENGLAVFAGEINLVQRQAESVANVAGVLEIGGGVAVTVVIVPVAHMETLDRVSLVAQQQGRDGRIHAAGQGNDGATSQAHAAILAG
jgi:hypothetical protein